ncbi:MAG: DUF3551 domain-containing protein [Bradyrhizobium sp.]|nr:DUF3551 domain-containing protein [Bradyrhizobium sp.]
MRKLVPFAATAALALLVQVSTPADTYAAPMTGAARYCLSYNEGGVDCGFVSLAQCNATAEGQGAECSVDYAEPARPMRHPHALR